MHWKYVLFWKKKKKKLIFFTVGKLYVVSEEWNVSKCALTGGNNDPDSGPSLDHWLFSLNSMALDALLLTYNANTTLASTYTMKSDTYIIICS